MSCPSPIYVKHSDLLPLLQSRGKRLSSSADNILYDPDSPPAPTTSEPSTSPNSPEGSNSEQRQLLILCKRLSSSTSSILSSQDVDVATPLITPTRRPAQPKRLSLPAPPHPYPLTSYLTTCPENSSLPLPLPGSQPSLLVHSLSSPALPLPYPDANPSSASLALLERALVRRHRHSVSGQMSYFKMLGFGLSPGGGFVVQQKKPGCGSTSSLFSTAVISGSSSAPNLRDMIPSTPSISGTETEWLVLVSVAQCYSYSHYLFFYQMAPSFVLLSLLFPSLVLLQSYFSLCNFIFYSHFQL